MTPWVAVLNISPRTAQKIIERHHIHPDEVRDAVVCVENLDGVWHDEPGRGRRFVAETRIRGRPVLVVLYPMTDDRAEDTWNLGSAYYE